MDSVPATYQTVYHNLLISDLFNILPKIREQISVTQAAIQELTYLILSCLQMFTVPQIQENTAPAPQTLALTDLMYLIKSRKVTQRVKVPQFQVLAQRYYLMMTEVLQRMI